MHLSFDRYLFSVWTVASVMLWPVKINFLNLNIPLISILAVAFCILLSRKLEFDKSLFTVIGTLFIFCLVSLGKCDAIFITKSFLSFLSFIPIIIVSYYFAKSHLTENLDSLQIVIRVIFITTIICFILQLFEVFNFNKGYRKAYLLYAPFLEPSHLAISLTPYILISIYSSCLKNKILSLIISASSFSTTMIGLFFTVIFYKSVFKNLVFIFLLVFFTAILFFIHDGFNSRISGLYNYFFAHHNHLNLSSKVYIYGYAASFFNLLETNFLGLGFNAMGCIDISSIDGMFNFFLLNHYDDGSFLASKVVSEFGLIGVVMLILLFAKILIVSYKGTEKYAPISHILSLTFICIFFIRSPSYYSIVHLLPFVIFFLRQPLQKKI